MNNNDWQKFAKDLQKKAENLAKSQGSSGRNSFARGTGGSPKSFLFGTGGLVLLGAALFFGQNTLYNVNGGERAVIYDRLVGIRPEVVGEGTHIKIPLLQFPTIYEIDL